MFGGGTSDIPNENGGPIVRSDSVDIYDGPLLSLRQAVVVLEGPAMQTVQSSSGEELW